MKFSVTQIKEQQDEEARQAWIAANPDKYTRGPDPGEDRAPAIPRKMPRALDSAIPRPHTQMSYAENTAKILAVLEAAGKPMTGREIAVASGYSYTTITEHMRQSNKVVCTKGGPTGRTKQYAIKRGQR